MQATHAITDIPTTSEIDPIAPTQIYLLADGQAVACYAGAADEVHASLEALCLVYGWSSDDLLATARPCSVDVAERSEPVQPLPDAFTVSVRFHDTMIEAHVDGNRVTIYRDDVWAGEGRWQDGRIVDCPASFRIADGSDVTEDAYETLEEAIGDKMSDV